MPARLAYRRRGGALNSRRPFNLNFAARRASPARRRTLYQAFPAAG
jgi:hypothetical protein